MQTRSDQARGKVADMEDKVSIHTARLVACQEELLGLQEQVKAAQQAADLVLITAFVGSAHVLPLSCCHCVLHMYTCRWDATESNKRQVVDVGSVLIHVANA